MPSKVDPHVNQAEELLKFANIGLALNMSLREEVLVEKCMGGSMATVLMDAGPCDGKRNGGDGRRYNYKPARVGPWVGGRCTACTYPYIQMRVSGCR